MGSKRIDKKAPDVRLPVPRKETIPAPERTAELSGLRNVEVRITLELGRTEITLEEAQSLVEKSLLAVDKLDNEPVEVCVNGKLFGRGRLVMVGDNYGVQLTEVVGQVQPR